MKETALVPMRLVPLMTTEVPTGPFTGVNPLIAGARTLKHLPALPELKMLATSAAVRARL